MASKMYILIRDDVDLGHAILASAHASLSGYLTFIEQEKTLEGRVHAGVMLGPTPTEIWAKDSFRKVVCRVTPKEFKKAKTYGLVHRVMVESGLGGAETAIVFAPRDEWPAFFKSLKLYK